jgi:uncharacterized repeat protein (TIGR01451 family)
MPGRPAAAATLVVVALGAAAVAPAAAEPALLVPRPATVKLADCSSEARSAAFHGRMKRIEGSERMRMRFKLLERRAARFEVIGAVGLGRWHRSNAQVGTFGYRQALRGLQPGASYRMQVNFRWYSAGGHLLAAARRRSVACRQSEQLPNLTASVSGATQTKAEGVLRYTVLVQNTGVAPAGGVAVHMTVDGHVLDTVTVDSLGPGESRLLGFRGPQCTASVSAAVDPQGVLAESSEDDNVQQASCADLPRT